MTVKQICRHFAVHRLVVHNNNIRSVGFLVGYAYGALKGDLQKQQLTVIAKEECDCIRFADKKKYDRVT